MDAFEFDDLKNQYDNFSEKIYKHLYDLRKIIIDNCKNPDYVLEGNCFYTHTTLNLCSDLYNKQINLFWCGKQANLKICEIGFNAGHSTMLMLLGNQCPLNFTIFDIGHHAYTIPCLEYIASQFKNVIFEYVEGDSSITMPKWIQENIEKIGTYDVVHIDGGHFENMISNDIKNADILVKKDGLLIIDDTNDDVVNKYVNLLLLSNNYIELNILKTKNYEHRILKKIN